MHVWERVVFVAVDSGLSPAACVRVRCFHLCAPLFSPQMAGSDFGGLCSGACELMCAERLETFLTQLSPAFAEAVVDFLSVSACGKWESTGVEQLV